MTIIIQSSARITTALDIITSAYQIAGEYGAGETVNDTDAQEGLDSLNDLLESIHNDRLSIHQIKQESFSLTSNDGQYTIGAGGDFDTDRPVKITGAYIRTSEGVDYPLTIIDNIQDYNRIVSKSISTEIPGYLYCNYAYPLATINLYPIPSESNTMYLFSWKSLGSFTNLTDQVSLPPGYNRFLKYNLAKELNTLCNGTMTAEAKEIAVASWALVKRTNRRPMISRIEPMTDSSYYDIKSDTYR